MSLSQKSVITFLLGGLTVWLVIGTLRFAMADTEDHAVHHHANFAVMVDGQKLDFSADQYMEDVGACSVDGTQRPEDRVHLHDNNGDTIHIHAEGATWGHFFANLGFTLGSDLLQTDDGRRYPAALSEDSEITFFLNGELVEAIDNQTIDSEDRLLIHLGEPLSEAVLLAQYEENVRSDAGEFNHSYDPGGCSGPDEKNLSQRLRESFWL